MRVSTKISNRWWRTGESTEVSHPFKHRRVLIAIPYVVLIASAELLIAYAPTLAIAFHAIILFALLIHSSLITISDYPFSALLQVLTIAPLIRILSLTMPLGYFGTITMIAIVSVPVYIAIFMYIYIQGLELRDVGLTRPKLNHLPLELATILLAIPGGILCYLIVRPGILIPEPSFGVLLVPALILIVSTGFLEELAFRGLMQYHATRTMGFTGIIIISALFGFLHIDDLLILYVIFAGSVGFIYSLIVQRTGSIYGVSISHGVINIMMFLIAPAYF